MKRIIAFFLVLALILGSIPFATAEGDLFEITNVEIQELLSNMYSVNFTVKNKTGGSVHDVTLTACFVDEEGNILYTLFPGGTARLKDEKSITVSTMPQSLGAACAVYIDSVSYMDTDEKSHKVYLDDTEEFSLLMDENTVPVGDDNKNETSEKSNTEGLDDMKMYRSSDPDVSMMLPAKYNVFWRNMPASAESLLVTGDSLDEWNKTFAESPMAVFIADAEQGNKNIALFIQPGLEMKDLDEADDDEIKRYIAGVLLPQGDADNVIRYCNKILRTDKLAYVLSYENHPGEDTPFYLTAISVNDGKMIVVKYRSKNEISNDEVQEYVAMLVSLTVEGQKQELISESDWIYSDDNKTYSYVCGELVFSVPSDLIYYDGNNKDDISLSMLGWDVSTLDMMLEKVGEGVDVFFTDYKLGNYITIKKAYVKGAPDLDYLNSTMILLEMERNINDPSGMVVIDKGTSVSEGTSGVNWIRIKIKNTVYNVEQLMYMAILNENQYIVTLEKKSITQEDESLLGSIVRNTEKNTTSNQIGAEQWWQHEPYDYLNYTILENGTIEITQYFGLDDCVAIPDEIDGRLVTSIGVGAFHDCFRLVNVRFPVGLEKIQDEAFVRCTALDDLYFPKGLKSIGAGAFYGCSNLKRIVIWDSVTDIGQSAFDYCNASLETITNNAYVKKQISQRTSNFEWYPTPEAIVSGDYQYNIRDDGTVVITKYLGNDEYLSIPDQIEQKKVYGFSYNAFSDKEFVTIEIPASMNNVKADWFSRCSVEEYVVSPENPYYYVENGVVLSADGLELVVYPNAKKEEEYMIPKSVRKIGDDAFYKCKNLKNVIFSDNVEVIGAAAFYMCESIEKLNLPEKLKTIDHRAFYGCSGLTSVIIPDSVLRLGVYAFAECQNLKSAEISSGVIYIESNPFINDKNLVDINVSPENHYYASIDDMLVDKQSNKLMAYPCGKDSDLCSIPDGVELIVDQAFYQCGLIKEIFIPDSVISIGSCAFSYCYGLESITIPKNVIYMGYRAICDFRGNSILAKVYKNSYAVEYCEENKYPYELIDEKQYGVDGIDTISITDAGDDFYNKQLLVREGNGLQLYTGTGQREEWKDHGCEDHVSGEEYRQRFPDG